MTSCRGPCSAPTGEICTNLLSQEFAQVWHFNPKYFLIWVVDIFLYTLKAFLVRYSFLFWRIETDCHLGKRGLLGPILLHGVLSIGGRSARIQLSNIHD